jgi:hypothetical protein
MNVVMSRSGTMSEIAAVAFLEDCLTRKSRRGKDDLFRQCTLVMGNRRTVTWVENRLAVKGKRFVIRGEDDSMDGVWEIETVYKGQSLTGDEVDTLESAHRHHRKRTDV